MAAAKKPAFLSGQPRARRLTTGGRTVKLLRAVPRKDCTCDTSVRDWAKTCDHNPYVGLVPRKYDVPIYEDVLEIGEPTGAKKVIKTEQHIEYHSRPNWKEATVNSRLGGLTRVGQALARGCIFPQDLVSPEYPEGIAECCEFRNCFQQKQPDGQPLIQTQYGKYCRPIEAKFAAVDQTGFVSGEKRLEIGFNNASLQKQRTQLEGMVVQ